MVKTETDKDIELMTAFKGGDENAFNELLKKYEYPIVNYIYRFTADLNDAQDLAQEVFVKIYRSRESYQPVSKFSSWLYAIATNACLDHRKFRKKDIVYHSRPVGSLNSDEEEKQTDIKDTSEKPVEIAVEQNLTDKTVKQALGSLAENQRLALILKEYEGKSYQEIAEILESSTSSVESLIFRARQNLKKKLCDAVK